MGITEAQQEQLASLATFELSWWRARGWLDARSFKDLARRVAPADFDARARLLAHCPA